MKKRSFFIIAAFLFLCDVFLKKYVMSAGTVGTVFYHVRLLPFVDFDLTYVQNKGMAWGMLASYQWVILTFRVIFLAVLSYFLIRSKKMQKQMLGYLLILFGAFGNVLDTFMYGYVVDMLNFTFWGRSYGIFNIADAMIFIGAFMIIFMKERPHALKD